MLWFSRGTRTKPVIVAASVASVLIAAQSAGQGSSDQIPIELYKEPSPKYLEVPECAHNGGRISDPVACKVLDSGMGGWAEVDFMVDPEGKPFEPTVTRSTGYKALDAMAIRAVEQSRFVPGTLNGKPIESSFKVRYKVWQGPSWRAGARSDFIKSYDALRHAVDADDRAAADAAIKRLVITNLYEDAYFGMASYFYATKWGDEVQQLEGLKRALSEEGNGMHFLPRDLFKSALQVTLRLQVQLHLYAEALDTCRTLQKAGLDEKTAAQTRSLMEQLDKIRTDGSSYVVSGELPEGNWFLHLFKRHFQAEVSEGHIAQVKLRCQKHYVSFAFDAKLEYDVAGKDGDCWMELIGAPGTRFKLMQF